MPSIFLLLCCTTTGKTRWPCLLYRCVRVRKSQATYCVEHRKEIGRRSQRTLRVGETTENRPATIVPKISSVVQQCFAELLIARMPSKLVFLGFCFIYLFAVFLRAHFDANYTFALRNFALIVTAGRARTSRLKFSCQQMVVYNSSRMRI